MNTTYLRDTAGYLQSYSVEVDTWWPDAGDTHELLGDREILADRLAELSPAQREQLARVDARVLELVELHAGNTAWDTTMLRRTADLIRLQASNQQAA